MLAKLRKQSKSKPKTDYEQLGKIVASIYETGYIDAPKSYKMSFVKGLFQGFGGAVGATLLVALVIWVLSLFSQVPLLSRITESLRENVNSAQQK